MYFQTMSTTVNPLMSSKFNSRKNKPVKEKKVITKQEVVQKQPKLRTTVYNESGTFTVDCCTETMIRHIVVKYDLDRTNRVLHYGSAVFSVSRKTVKELKKKHKKDNSVQVPTYNFKKHLEYAEQRFNENPVIVTHVMCNNLTNLPGLIRNIMYKYGCCAEINKLYRFNASMQKKVRSFETYYILSEKKCLYFQNNTENHKRHVALVYEYNRKRLTYGANIWNVPKNSTEEYHPITCMGYAIKRFDENPVVVKNIVLNKNVVSSIRNLMYARGCETRKQNYGKIKRTTYPKPRVTKANSKVLSLVEKYEGKNNIVVNNSDMVTITS